jgi:excisionase family DNA binding protein
MNRFQNWPANDTELDATGYARQTAEIVLGLQEQIATLIGAVRFLEERLPPRVVAVDEAARQLSVSVQTIRRWCKSGALPYLRRGRELRIDLTKVRALGRDDVRRLIDEKSAMRGPPRDAEPAGRFGPVKARS